jgi:hypothetical protein
MASQIPSKADWAEIAHPTLGSDAKEIQALIDPIDKVHCGNGGLKEDLRSRVSEGLLYTHSRLTSNSQKTMEGLSFLYALIELLSERGLIDIEALDARKRVVGRRLAKQFKKSGNGALFQDPEYDKYSFEGGAEIDCGSRVHLCRAACCRLPFALSKQDIREGVVRWDLGQPYLIDQSEDGYCSHMDRCSLGCTVYERRPVPCRGFDCRKDPRIWLDFDNRRINPDIHRAEWPRCLASKETGAAQATQSGERSVTEQRDVG